MEILYLLFLGIYARLLWSMKREWVAIRDDFPPETVIGNVAVLIPFRNESQHLPKLLLNLEQSTASCQEVVFIDDHSDDHSRKIVASYIRERNYTHWVLLDNPGVGKKAALTVGVEHVSAEIILTTDADCFLPADWSSKMAQAFNRESLQLIAGPVMTLTRPGLFARFQQIEWASLLLVTNYLFSRNAALMCSGANLGYRRSAFLAVKGYVGNERYLSGDDEFLLKKILQTYGTNSVTYLKDKELLVKTYPLTTWRGLLQQRIRWAGKGKVYRSYRHLIAASSAYMVSLLQLSTVVLVLDAASGIPVFIVFWMAKVVVERYVLKKVLVVYGICPGVLQMIFASVLHPVYVVIVGLFALFGNSTWKGRNNRFMS